MTKQAMKDHIKIGFYLQVLPCDNFITTSFFG